MSEEKTIDCRGLACPEPVIRTRKTLDETGSSFVVLVDSDASMENVSRFAENRGAGVSVEKKGDEFHLTIEPGQSAPAAEDPPIVCPTGTGRDLVVYVSSEFMGSGDDGLGAVLMAAFLDTLSQFKEEISHVIFLNAGARLAVEGSPVLDQIRQLEQVGVEVLVCGTCLNHFGIKDKLAAGSVSNMYAIIETLSNARRIIRT